MTAEFGNTPELFRVSGRSLNGTGRVDRGQSIEPIHPDEYTKPIEPTTKEVVDLFLEDDLRQDYLAYQTGQRASE